MREFNYTKVKSATEATGAFANSRKRDIPVSDIQFLAGGTTLIDLMKLEVERPSVVVDVNALPFAKVERSKEGGLHIGALVKNADLAQNDEVKKDYAVLSQALLSGASPQLRNKATTAGNLLQRTRCVYFRDPHMPCNKREPGTGCSAIHGFNRNLAILGTSEHCIASNPSDMNVALMALDARIKVQGAGGEREIPISEFYLLPGTTPHKETLLQKGELITGVTLPALGKGTRSSYLKLRDRASYEFALSSAAVVCQMQGANVAKIQIAMGGIGARPWRVPDAEKVLQGGPLTDEKIKAACDVFLKGAKPQSENGFKVELARRCLAYALKQYRA